MDTVSVWYCLPFTLPGFVAASMDQAMRQKYTLVLNFQCLGVPLKESKLVGPVTYLTFLGIQDNH